MVRLAIVSDTHLPKGSRSLPEPCVERLRGADAILHCGDFITEAVLTWFEELGPALYSVWGNVDHAGVRRRIPQSRVVEVAGARIGMVHVPGSSAGRLERLRRRFPDADAAVFGHTHMPEHAEHGGFEIFNPGSPTERRRAPARTMGIATIRAGRIAFELVTVG